MLKRVGFFVSLVIFGLVSFCDWVKSAVKIKMGTIIDNNDEEKRDLDDSGCVQDGSPQQPTAPGVDLLDLSDDVLLYILRHCAPRDLKALGFSCPRLGRLVRERSLWRCVDARSERCGLARLNWYVTHALHADTRQLYVQGYAEESSGCLGILNCSRQEAEEEQKAHLAHKNEVQNGTPPRTANVQRHHACLYISAHSAAGLPRFRGSPLWADEEGTCRTGPQPCGGPRFTVCDPLLRELRVRCCRLTRLALENCNVNCNTMNLGQLPPTLTQLSLRGAKCFNLPMDKSFLFKIQDYLPLLESLDVSECEWLEPASLLPLSKHGRLRELLMRDCHKLAEFVAYASLSSRYGFRSLQVLDLRGSPVGDSEVAPLAWLPRLQELRLSATSRLSTATRRAARTHGHYADDAVAPRQDLDEWEMQVPEYFKGSSEEVAGAGDGGMAWGGAPQPSDDDDDAHDDMGGGSSGGIRKDGACEQGESSRSKRDSTTKRKAEDGGGDAGVNGDQRPKRRRNSKDDGSSSEDSGDDVYEKRRCQTIVIVDRRFMRDEVRVSKEQQARGDDEPKKQDDSDKSEDKPRADEVKAPSDAPSSSKKAKLDSSEVNQGASTSKEARSDDKGNAVNENGNNEKPANGNDDGERYVRFRQGEKPIIVNVTARPGTRQEILQPERVVSFNSYNIRHEVIDNQQIFNVEIERCAMHEPRPGQRAAEGAVEGQQDPQAPPPPRPPPEPAQDADDVQREAMERARLRERNPNIMNLIRGGGEPLELPPPLAFFPPLPDENREPRHRVLYVNVGQPANALGPLPNVIQGLVSDRDNRILNLSRSQLNPSALVTDAAVRRFGRASGNDIRFVLVGIPHPVLGPAGENGTRPERSSLRVLVMNGYRNITDRSLVHLATAAPQLRLLDFRETSVTAEGVENFRSLRPDCEVLFSPYVERKVEWPDEDD